MQEFTFYVSRPSECRTGGWQFSVASQRLKMHGPFESQSAANRFRRALEARWRERVAHLQGTFRLESHTEWVIAVPEGVPVMGLRRRASGIDERKRPDPRDDPPLRLRRGPWKSR